MTQEDFEPASCPEDEVSHRKVSVAIFALLLYLPALFSTFYSTFQHYFLSSPLPSSTIFSLLLYLPALFSLFSSTFHHYFLPSPLPFRTIFYLLLYLSALFSTFSSTIQHFFYLLVVGQFFYILFLFCHCSVFKGIVQRDFRGLQMILMERAYGP